MKFAVILFIISCLAAYFLMRRFKPKPDNPFDPAQIRNRKIILDKILALAKARTQISNKDVQNSLGLNEQAADQNLQYLVNLNKLSKIADRGRDPVYKVI